MTGCKSSDHVPENVATQNEHRGGCVTPGPLCFHSQGLVFGLGRDYHLMDCLWQLKEVPNRTWQVWSRPEVIFLSCCCSGLAVGQ